MSSGMSTNSRLSILTAFGPTLFWGLSYAFTKGLLQSLTPVEIAVFRFLIGSVALLVLSVVMKRLQPIKREHLPRAIAAGVIGVTVYFLFENYGLNYTSASAGSLIIASIPVINLLVSWLSRSEQITVAGTIGVLLSFAGVYVLVKASPDQTGSSLSGNLLVLGAAISWVVYTRINAPLINQYDLFALNTFETCVGTIALVPVGIYTGISLPAANLNIWLSLAYLGFICSAAAYVLYLIALKQLGSVVVTTFVNLVPVFGVIAAVVILGERIAAEQLWGGLMILAGVVLVTKKGKREDDAHHNSQSRPAQSAKKTHSHSTYYQTG